MCHGSARTRSRRPGSCRGEDPRCGCGGPEHPRPSTTPRPQAGVLPGPRIPQLPQQSFGSVVSCCILCLSCIVLGRNVSLVGREIVDGLENLVLVVGCYDDVSIVLQLPASELFACVAVVEVVVVNGAILVVKASLIEFRV